MSATFWRMNDTPIAVMSGATRGAWRSGRYTRRSMLTFRNPMIGIVNASAARTKKMSGMTWSTGPVCPKTPPMRTTDRNAPSMKISPWAKLMSSMIP